MPQGQSLVVDDVPVVFFGVNAHYLLNDQFPEAESIALLRDLSERGVNTVRVWFFHDHDPDRFDRLLDAGRGQGIRFVVVLADNVFKGVDWFFGREDREDYRPHLERTVTRFKDRPEILLWEPVNEPGCGEGRHDKDCLKRIRDWLSMTSRRIRQLDPCRAVSSGFIGDGNYPDEERNYRLVHGKESIGIVSAHKRSTEERASEVAVANDKNMPIYYGEIYDQAYDDGCSPLAGGDELERRAERVKADLRQAIADGVDGYLLWNYAASGYCSKFGFEPDDPVWGKIRRAEGLPPVVPWSPAR